MKRIAVLLSCGGEKKCGLICKVDGPFVSKVNRMVFTEGTSCKDIGISEKQAL